VRVHWTHTAIAHLLAIYEHIAQHAPLYAQRTVDRLTRRSEQIAMFPQSGRLVPEYGAPDIREWTSRSFLPDLPTVQPHKSKPRSEAVLLGTTQPLSLGRSRRHAP
jgi:toxin ParE1/3/4